MPRLQSVGLSTIQMFRVRGSFRENVSSLFFFALFVRRFSKRWQQHQYCSDHRSHGCKVIVDAKVVPICPLCEQAVEIATGASVDDCIDAHIASGCKSGVQKKHAPSKRGVETCLVPRCKELMLLLSCGACDKVVCVQHRAQHTCVPKAGAATRKTGVLGIDTRSPAQLAAARRQISVK